MWSAGVCLYNFVTGENPYLYTHSYDPWFSKIENHHWETFWNSTRSQLPNYIKELISFSLEINPQKRATARFLLDKIDETVDFSEMIVEDNVLE